jgi:hypothetical protein
VLAGIFVIVSGKLLVAGALVTPPTMLLASLILELVDGVAVGLLELSLLQPTSANAARTVIADSGIINFISYFSFLLFMFVIASVMSKVSGGH